MISEGKVQQLLEKSEHLLQEKRFYEYEQKLKTFASRFISAEKIPEAVDLLFGGAIRLFDVKDETAAYSLTNMAITTIKDKQLDFEKNYKSNFDSLHPLKINKSLAIEKFFELFALIPYSKEKLEFVIRVMTIFYPKEQDKEISMVCAEEAMKKEDYHLAQKFLVKCDDSNKLAVTLLRQWMKLGEPYENDLFVVRYILLKLAVHRLADAKFIHDAFRKEIKTPLMNFAGLLIKAAELKSQKAFEVLIEGYEISYSRDPTFIKILRKIGSVYFGFVNEHESMFTSFFKMLTSS